MLILQDLGMEYPKPESKSKRRYYMVECPICKEHFKCLAMNVNSGVTKNCNPCGYANVKGKHNESKTRLHNIWGLMKRRCFNLNDKDYKNYGGRGIKVSKKWKKSYIVFRDWARANGYSGTLTIDRIDNDGNYKPSNCRWVTMKEQSKNKRNSK